MADIKSEYPAGLKSGSMAGLELECMVDFTGIRYHRTVSPLQEKTSCLGCDDSGERAAMLYTILESSKLNGVNPEAYLAEVIDRMAKAIQSTASARLLP